MTGPLSTAIWWVRRDLRLTDNQALQSVLESTDQVVPVFILDPNLLSSPYASEKRTAFLMAGLHSLDEQLHQCGSRLIIRQGDPLEQLTCLVGEIQPVNAIFAEPDYSPYARQRNDAVARSLPVRWTGSPAIHPPGSVIKADGLPYTVFTPFSRAWKALPSFQSNINFTVPARINTRKNIDSLPIPTEPTLPATVLFSAGEGEAQRRLRDFLGGGMVNSYATQRNRVDLDATSQLSPNFRFGMISARQAAVQAIAAQITIRDKEAQEGIEIWLNELIWRDFYIHILYHFPRVHRFNFRMKNIPWKNDRDNFIAWCNGHTGYPAVDAAMCQLIQTGWIHNRARMLVASFLTKDLLTDWQWGERFFMQHLINGDPAANNGGWQWTAGTCADAAPYFRVFNPIMQSARYDPEGIYIRHRVPELVQVPQEYIHTPWKMPSDIQQSTGCLIGRDYRAPIVDHAAAKERALVMYASAR